MKHRPLFLILMFLFPFGVSLAQGVAEPTRDLPAYEFVEYVTLSKPTRSSMSMVDRSLVETCIKICLTDIKDVKAKEVRLGRSLAPLDLGDRAYQPTLHVGVISIHRYRAKQNPIPFYHPVNHYHLNGALRPPSTDESSRAFSMRTISGCWL